jgi:hypothetical protein
MRTVEVAILRSIEVTIESVGVFAKEPEIVSISVSEVFAASTLWRRIVAARDEVERSGELRIGHDMILCALRVVNRRKTV